MDLITLDCPGKVPKGVNLGIIYIGSNLVGEVESVLAVLRSALGIATLLNQSCCPIGSTRAITKVNENLLIALDDETALATL